MQSHKSPPVLGGVCGSNPTDESKSSRRDGELILPLNKTEGVKGSFDGIFHSRQTAADKSVCVCVTHESGVRVVLCICALFITGLLFFTPYMCPLGCSLR